MTQSINQSISLHLDKIDLLSSILSDSIDYKSHARKPEAIPSLIFFSAPLFPLGGLLHGCQRSFVLVE